MHGAGIAPPPPREANKVNAELLQTSLRNKEVRAVLSHPCEQEGAAANRAGLQLTRNPKGWVSAGAPQADRDAGPQGQQAGQRRVQGTERAVPLEVTGNTATPAAPRSPAGCC